MKRIKFSVFTILFILIYSCQTDNNTGIPVINKLTISNSNDNETDIFTVGDTIYFGLTVTDSELDIKKAVITQYSEEKNIEPIYIDLPEQQLSQQYYHGTLTAEYAGKWSVEIYILDSIGNKSNVIKKIITIKNKGIYNVYHEQEQYKIKLYWTERSDYIFESLDILVYYTELGGWNQNIKYENQKGKNELIFDIPLYVLNNNIKTINIIFMVTIGNIQTNLVVYPITIISNENNYIHEISNIQQSYSNNKITLNWDNPTDNNFSYIKLYTTGTINNNSIPVSLRDNISTYEFNINNTNINAFTFITIDKYGNESAGLIYNIKFAQDVIELSCIMNFNAPIIQWIDPNDDSFDHVIIEGFNNIYTVNKGIQICNVSRFNSSFDVCVRAVDLNGNVSRGIIISKDYAFNPQPYIINVTFNNSGPIIPDLPYQYYLRDSGTGRGINVGEYILITPITGLNINTIEGVYATIYISNTFVLNNESTVINVGGKYRNVTYILPLEFRKIIQ